MRSKSYSIADLAAAGGVSRRTVHFYVQRRLLPPPDGLGRAARYSDRHLARLLQIKAWQEQGVPLEEIRGLLTEAEKPSPHRMRLLAQTAPLGVPAQKRHGQAARAAVLQRWTSAMPAAPGSAWFRQPLAPGVELHVAASARPLDPQQLAALARALGEILKQQGEEE